MVFSSINQNLNLWQDGMKPQEIEALSFKIIEDEAGSHGFDQQHWPIVRRVIHTSADFEYINSIRFSKNAVEKGITAIQNGCRIITDTNMARVGIRKGEISVFGGRADCLMTDETVAKLAKENG
jgi:precorrin-8X/cobalt-precorrin-8 methylmutase